MNALRYFGFGGGLLGGVLLGLLLQAATTTTAWGHGFELSVQTNGSGTPVGINVSSNQPVLDQDGTPPPAGSPMNTYLFVDQFQSAGTDTRGDFQYTPEGGPYFLPALPNGSTTTFTLTSPLYYSDGGAAVPASGTTNIYYSDSADPNPATSGIHTDLAGNSVAPVPGFQLLNADGTYPENGHEIAKQIYLDPTSTQTSGEYGFGFTVTVHLPGGQTLSTPTLTDIFALNDFTGTNSGLQSFLASDARQDAASTNIFNAVNPPTVPEPSGFILAASGVMLLGLRRFRRRRTGAEGETGRSDC